MLLLQNENMEYWITKRERNEVLLADNGAKMRELKRKSGARIETKTIRGRVLVSIDNMGKGAISLRSLKSGRIQLPLTSNGPMLRLDIAHAEEPKHLS